MTNRNCWAIDTLIAEVHAIEPEVEIATGEPGEFGAHLEATFSGCSPNLVEALMLAQGDERVENVLSGSGGLASLLFHDSAVLKDLRDPFDIAAAMSILDGEEEEA